MRRRGQVRLLIAAAVLTVAAAVWFGAKAQRSAAEVGARTQESSEERLEARLGHRDRPRGCLLAGRERFLGMSYRAGISSYRETTGELGPAADLGASGDAGIAARGPSHLRLAEGS